MERVIYQIHVQLMQILMYCVGAAKGQTDDCKCVDLPSGERLCDPIDCELYSQKMTVQFST